MSLSSLGVALCGCVHKLVCEPMLCGLAMEPWGCVAGVVIAYLHSKYYKYSLCWVHAQQCVWQLGQGQELSILKEKIDATQETGVTNCVLDGQTAMGLASLDGCVELLEKQERFLLDWQEQDSNTWHNVMFNLCEEVQEGEEKMAHLQDLLNIQRKLNQQLCLSFNEAR